MLEAKQGGGKTLYQIEKAETMLPRRSGQITKLTNRMLVYDHFVLDFLKPSNLFKNSPQYIDEDLLGFTCNKRSIGMLRVGMH